MLMLKLMFDVDVDVDDCCVCLGDALNARGELYLRHGHWNLARDSFETASAAAIQGDDTAKRTMYDRNVRTARSARQNERVQTELVNRTHETSEEEAAEWMSVAKQWSEMEHQHQRIYKCALQAVHVVSNNNSSIRICGLDTCVMYAPFLSYVSCIASRLSCAHVVLHVSYVVHVLPRCLASWCSCR